MDSPCLDLVQPMAELGPEDSGQVTDVPPGEPVPLTTQPHKW